MATIAEGFAAAGQGLRSALAGHQSYFLEVLGAPAAAGLSVVSFEATERLGEPYTVTVTATHPLELDRAAFLRHDATFLIAPPDGAEPRTFGGCITAFSKTGESRDFRTYVLELRPKVALLTLATASRVYQNQTAPQIIETILRRHGLEGQQFSFRIRRSYPEHKFRLQYRMSDWAYIRLLMEQEGLFSYFVPGKFSREFGDVFTVADDIDHYLYQPALHVPYRETAGLEAGTETVFVLRTHARTVPESFVAADYHPEHAYERLRSDANIARKEAGNYGQPYVFGTHHFDAAGAQWEAQLRHESAMAGQLVYEGESNVLCLRPARILRTDAALPDAPDGQVVTEVFHAGGRNRAYRNRYRAIPSGRRFRLPMDESQWPRIAGTLSGRITSPGKYDYAYLTRAGHYVVRFDLDFDEWPRGAECVPLRLAKPFAGASQTGFHFPLIGGTEVAIAFHDGNPNRPYIAHALHNSQHEDLVTGRDRWLSRNVIRTQRNNKLRFEDWAGQEGIKLSTEHSGKSQLNLGCLVDSRRQPRGAGFELRTAGWGALRAGKGVLISAYDQSGAGGNQLEMEHIRGLLQQALQTSEALAEAARTAQAEAADCRRQQALLSETLEQLKRAGLLASAPAGMALVSGADLQCTAHENLIATAGGHADVSVLKRFTVAAGERISMFAQKLGIKLCAARGKVEIQARSDEMRLLADRNLFVSSANGCVVIEAREELVLKCGGSYLRMSATGIEDGTRGERIVKSAGFWRQGPSSMSQEMNQAEQAAFHDPYVLRNSITNALLKHHPYEVIRDDGTRIRGVSDEMGRTSAQKNLDLERVTVRVLRKEGSGDE
ncbi:type VI secretion system Vgr family protein [Cupriavidus agavae]|uniref:Type VI secretion system secreted protein VgrG n=1 Tax=Cupriavidus agavae TaxID=1001822 RepID=A0A4Q7RVQ0_9BURK|nr:type VI secretion system Vgr family protein [Cupriavidus agavae]RZT36422.1 type VI secretion system secreted protein VgrG [Cupriavidus agavae]